MKCEEALIRKSSPKIRFTRIVQKSFHEAVDNSPSLDFFFEFLTEAELFQQQYYKKADEQIV